MFCPYISRLPSEQQPQQQQQPANSGPSPSRLVSTSAATSTQNGANRSSQPVAGGAKPGALPANLDEFKVSQLSNGSVLQCTLKVSTLLNVLVFQVAELKQELKLRGLTVSGTKNDLIERLKNYQEQNGGVVVGSGPMKTVQVPPQEVAVQSKDAIGKGAAYAVAMSSGIQAAALPQITRFNSTSSSPPVSPSPSERSVAGMSADETSCNGDVFGEMVGSVFHSGSVYRFVS